jgi:hypothetical protein
MAKIGPHFKLTVDRARRDATRTLFAEGLGAAILRPGPPDLEVYELADGARIGVYYVEPEAALREGDQAKGAWLEILVDDEAAARERLVRLGAIPVAYHDEAHAYLRIPGGPVFRLARG